MVAITTPENRTDNLKPSDLNIELDESSWEIYQNEEIAEPTESVKIAEALPEEIIDELGEAEEIENKNKNDKKIHKEKSSGEEDMGSGSELKKTQKTFGRNYLRKRNKNQVEKTLLPSEKELIKKLNAWPVMDSQEEFLEKKEYQKYVAENLKSKPIPKEWPIMENNSTIENYKKMRRNLSKKLESDPEFKKKYLDEQKTRLNEEYRSKKDPLFTLVEGYGWAPREVESEKEEESKENRKLSIFDKEEDSRVFTIKEEEEIESEEDNEDELEDELTGSFIGANPYDVEINLPKKPISETPDKKIQFNKNDDESISGFIQERLQKSGIFIYNVQNLTINIHV